MRDWAQVARQYDKLVFDFTARGKFLPLIKLDKRHQNYPGDSFTLVTYIGSDSIDKEWLGGEAINCMAAVVGASLVGIDKTRQDGNNYVLMSQKWFNSENGENVYLNKSDASTGQSFWYELFPNLLAYQLNDLYPNTGDLPKHVVSVADRYYEASVGMGGRTDPWILPEFNYKSFNLKTGRPSDVNTWREPDAAAGIAWLEYMAWRQHHNPKFLAAADWGMEYLSKRAKSPYYEMLLPYGAYLAARMDAELGRQYDVGKILDWVFDGNSECRPGWGVVAERWGDVDAHGLVGSLTDGEGYAFAMNGYQQAGALVPLVRYDKRYAHDVAKWMLNLANASRLFYANAHDPDHQSCWDWAEHYDRDAVLAYEGLRKLKHNHSAPLSDFRLVKGRIVSGDFRALRYAEDGETEVLEEQLVDGEQAVEHIWDFDLPAGEGRALLMEAAVQRHSANSFLLSMASSPSGPWRVALNIDRSDSYWYQLPDDLSGRVYLKVESSDRSRREGGLDRLTLDYLLLGWPTKVSPYAQGDMLPGKRPGSVTDFSLYSGSHVGILGGIVRTTNVPQILRLDLLRTDYYHDRAFPTYLYFNPYDTAKTVQVEAGAGAVDLYDSVSGRFVARNVTVRGTVTIPPDTAMVLVLAPAKGRLTIEKGVTLVNGVAIDYGGVGAARSSR